jgi:uncharacterized protein YndB with AHSA1/START domain
MNATTTASAETSSKRPFVITWTFAASRDAVFRAWTQRERLMQWFGPKGLTMVKADIDLRPGGLFHYGLQTPDGHEMWGKWVFREITAPEQIAFMASFSDAAGGVTRHPLSATWPLEMLSIVTFAQQDEGTLLILRAVPHGASEIESQTFASAHDGMQKGWAGTLHQLDAYLANSHNGEHR